MLNDPVNFIDPWGLLSYTVSRPLSNPAFGSIANHMFVVSHAEYIGDPNAKVHSFGRLANGNAGNVKGATSGGSEDTFGDDSDFWNSLNKRNCIPGVPFKPAPVTKINARDDVVSEFANRVIENRTYNPFGFNSNAIAQAVAERASGGPTPLPPDGKWTPGATGTSSEVNFR